MKVPKSQIVIAKDQNKKILFNFVRFFKKTKSPKEKTKIALIRGRIAKG
jgi:hypothetical protein